MSVEEGLPRISNCSKAAGGVRQDVDRLWQELHRTREDLSAACITPERVVRVVEVANAGLRKRLEELENSLGEVLGMQRSYAESLGVVQTHVEELEATRLPVIADGTLLIQRRLEEMERQLVSPGTSVLSENQPQRPQHDGSVGAASSTGPSVRTSDMSVEISGACTEQVAQKLYSTTWELRAEAVAQSASLESRVASAEAIFNAGLKHIRGVLSTCMVDMANLQPRVADLERVLSLTPAAGPVPQTHVTRAPSAALAAAAAALEAAEAAHTTVKCTGSGGAAMSKSGSDVSTQQQPAASLQPQQQHTTPTGATVPTQMGACGTAPGPGSGTCALGPFEATAQQASNARQQAPGIATLLGGSHAHVTHASSAAELGLAALAQRRLHITEPLAAAPTGLGSKVLDGIATASAACSRPVDSRLEAQQEPPGIGSTYSRSVQLLSPVEPHKQQQPPASLTTFPTVQHQPRTPGGQVYRDLLVRGTRGFPDARSSLPPWLGSPRPQSRGLQPEKEQQVVLHSRNGHSAEPEPVPRDSSPARKTMSTWKPLSSARSVSPSSFVPAPLGSGVAFLAQVPTHHSPQLQKRDVTPTTWQTVTSTPQLTRR